MHLLSILISYKDIDNADKEINRPRRLTRDLTIALVFKRSVFMQCWVDTSYIYRHSNSDSHLKPYNYILAFGECLLMSIKSVTVTWKCVKQFIEIMLCSK